MRFVMRPASLVCFLFVIAAAVPESRLLELTTARNVALLEGLAEVTSMWLDRLSKDRDLLLDEALTKSAALAIERESHLRRQLGSSALMESRLERMKAAQRVKVVKFKKAVDKAARRLDRRMSVALDRLRHRVEKWSHEAVSNVDAAAARGMDNFRSDRPSFQTYVASLKSFTQGWKELGEKRQLAEELFVAEVQLLVPGYRNALHTAFFQLQDANSRRHGLWTSEDDSVYASVIRSADLDNVSKRLLQEAKAWADVAMKEHRLTQMKPPGRLLHSADVESDVDAHGAWRVNKLGIAAAGNVSVTSSARASASYKSNRLSSELSLAGSLGAHARGRVVAGIDPRRKAAGLAVVASGFVGAEASARASLSTDVMQVKGSGSVGVGATARVRLVARCRAAKCSLRVAAAAYLGLFASSSPTITETGICAGTRTCRAASAPCYYKAFNT